MNKMLANLLSALNALVALCVIVGFVFYGATFGQPSGELSLGGGITGLVVGVVFAAIFCGLIAFLALIEGHLGYLVQQSEYQSEIAKLTLEKLQQ